MSNKPPNRGVLFRPIFRFFMGLELCGVALATLIWIKSLGPEQGANMILMALPMVAFPTLLVALGLLLLILADDDTLGPRERRLGTALGIAGLITFGSLFAVG